MMASGNVHVTDALTSDSGQYTCSAYNYITGESIESRRVVRLGVKTGPSRARSVVLTWQPAEKTIAQLGKWLFNNTYTLKACLFPHSADN